MEDPGMVDLKNISFESSIFPCNINIEDVRESIMNRQDFREVKGADFSAFIYFLGQGQDVFPNPEEAPDERTKLLWQLRRECRGLIFDENEKLISRRFHKFFNVNELPETTEQVINLDQDFEVLEKLDGSMISPFWTQGKLRFCTKQGPTDASILVENFISKNETKINYISFSEYAIENGFTPIFEWCDTQNPIVLAYETDKLTLISIRHNETGNYIEYNLLTKIAEQYCIPCSQKWTTEKDIKKNENQIILEKNHLNVDLTNKEQFSTFFKEIRSQEGIEGFVIRFTSGKMYKIKTEWYFKLTKESKL